MRPYAEYTKVLHHVADGLNDCQIARVTGIPRCTVRDWRRGRNVVRRTDPGWLCPQCGHPTHGPATVPRPPYAYLLGLYLGDGHISRYPRTWRLRIFLDLNWLRILLLCADAMETVFPGNQVSMYCPDPRSRCAVVSVHSNQIACLFPQHGPGPKHTRTIQLEDWQEELVHGDPKPFVRGLIQSDGCRFMNRVRVNGKRYEYPRYNFTNASDDIRTLFTDACDRLGIEWRQMNARNISVARRDSVALLDTFVGPKS
jgi:hypothetical protein